MRSLPQSTLALLLAVFPLLAGCDVEVLNGQNPQELVRTPVMSVGGQSGSPQAAYYPNGDAYYPYSPYYPNQSYYPCCPNQSYYPYYPDNSAYPYYPQTTAPQISYPQGVTPQVTYVGPPPYAQGNYVYYPGLSVYYPGIYVYYPAIASPGSASQAQP